MIFLISGIVFWNVSYYNVTSRVQLLHEKALHDFEDIVKLAKLLKAVEDERFISIMYLEKSSGILSLQSMREELDRQLLFLSGLKEGDKRFQESVEKVEHYMKELKTLRKRVIKKEVDSENIALFYTDKLAKNLLDLMNSLIQPINIKSLTAFVDFQRALEFSAIGRDLTLVVMSKNELDIDWFERLNTIDARAQGYFDHYKVNANDKTLHAYRSIYNKEYFITINQLKQIIREQFSDHNSSEGFDLKAWYTSSNMYLQDLEKIVGMQKEIILDELKVINAEDIQVRNKNLILLLIPLMFILVVAFYFFLDMRFALNVILDFLSDDKSVSDDRRMILKSAQNEFGDVYRALIKYNGDIKEQMEINRKTYEYDSLTELPNRIKLLQSVEKNIKKGRYQTIFYIDIFNFSHINNSFGQDVGDTFLKESAKELIALLYRVGMDEYNNLSVYRVGSDEFVILCLSKERESDLTQLLQRTYLVESHDIVIPLSFTFGISTVRDDSTPSSLLSNAEIAATYAKQSHRHFEIFDDYMIKEANHKENLEWVKKISNAFENGLFEVHYQPIFNTFTKEIVKYEVLIRMRSAEDDREIISPSEFLEILQRSGHEKDLTKVIIDQSFSSYEECGIDLSINMTSDDLDDEMVEYLVSEVQKHQIEPENITIELVESEELLKTRYIDIIQKIKAYGFKLAIDDFGTGYSNFAYLTQIKPNYIKIDGSLVRDICENEQHARVVEGIYDFAQSLDIQTIAEFVSSEAIYNDIKEIGIEFVQGFYLGEVMSCDTIKKLREGEKV